MPPAAPRRICVLHVTYDGTDSSFAEVDDFLPALARHLPGDVVELHALRKATVEAQLDDLAARGFDVYVNLCDGAADEPVAGVEVIASLARRGLPYTGPDAAFYAVDKRTTKAVARRLGLQTPRAVFVQDREDVEAAARTLRFPLIVKHPNGYASVGMTAASRVETPEALRREAAAALERHAGALVEEFIAGREATVLVVERPSGPPRAYPPLEIVFPPGETFKHADLKWRTWRSMQGRRLEDPALAERLAAETIRIFEGLRGSGYARCDFRIDAEGAPWLLEINPMCGCFYPPGAEGNADVILNDAPGGHAAFLEDLFAVAQRRGARRAPAG